jgi:hypothetical protein
MAVRSVAFYAVSDGDHFLGLVTLLNSLRLAGHREPFFVADCGLEEWQRDLLAGHADVVTVDVPSAPYLLKPLVPLDRPADVMALLDADLMVLRSLAALLESAAAGRIVAFADPVSHRFDPRWEALLHLPPLRRQPYVNSGLLVLPADPGTRVLQATAVGGVQVDYARTRPAGGQSSDPFYYLDQDVLNGVLASLVQPNELEILETRLAPHPPFAGLRRIGGEGRRYGYADGSEPYVLHHIDRKPWLSATRRNLYSELMPRLLLGDGVTVRLDAKNVPRRFRPGLLPALDRMRIEAAALAHDQRGKLGLRRRLGERLAARGSRL